MEILFYETLPSTQLYLADAVRSGRCEAPLAVWCKEQSSGIGSRNNEWIGERGNLFFSIAIPVFALPSDLPSCSASIYFAYIMKDLLSEDDKNIWLKWPNDIYSGGKKAGGVITQLIKNVFVVGIGINFVSPHPDFGKVRIDRSIKNILESYLSRVENPPSWKEIFSKYQLEFNESRGFFAHFKEEKVSLDKALLCEDGSLLVNGERVFSLR